MPLLVPVVPEPDEEEVDEGLTLLDDVFVEDVLVEDEAFVDEELLVEAVDAAPGTHWEYQSLE